MAVQDPSAKAALPWLVEQLRPFIERIAAIKASVHTKLRAGFLVGALLLVAMAAASLAVQAHIAGRIDELNRAQERLDGLRQMYYLVTAQSHYRTMSLLTHDDSYVQSIAQAKAEFQTHLDELEPILPAGERGLLARVREANQRFAVSSDQVLALYQAGQYQDALRLHLAQEHPISHDIEQPISALLDQAAQQMEASQATVDSDQRLLTGLFIGFSVVSLAVALLLGFVMSWSFLLPLGMIHRALERIAGGRFDAHVELSNRDEFGALARNLNTTSQELASMYGQLQTLNTELEGTNRELVSELQARVEELDRSRSMITEAEERMRRELAEVLHSRVQNRLLSIWYRLEEIQDQLESDSVSAKADLGHVRDQLDDIREHDVRELSHRLHPSIIRAGLLPALEVLAEETPKVRVELRASADVEELDDALHNGIPETIRLTVYRVVEEALGNVVKHANAQRATVELRLVDGGLQVEVIDDGMGFDVVRPGLGLSSMAARVGRVGGTWSIRSAPGHGATVSAVLPCSVEQLQDGLRTEAAFGQEHGAEAGSDRSVARSL